MTAQVREPDVVPQRMVDKQEVAAASGRMGGSHVSVLTYCLANMLWLQATSPIDKFAAAESGQTHEML